MKVLVTAFDPFGGNDTNSSMMVLEILKDYVDDIEIKKLIIPTVYTKCASIVWEEAVRLGADAVLSLGQAGGRAGITVEVVGINYAYAGMKDNAGVMKNGEKLFENGADALFSTLPVKAMVEAAQRGGFRADLSLSAGGFVCNSLLYTLLRNAREEGSSLKVGFVHLPYETGQLKEGFSMDRADMALCVEEMIREIKNSERI